MSKRIIHQGVKASDKPIGIGELRHRVVLCTARDIADESGSIRLIREEAKQRRVKIEEKTKSMWSRDGMVIKTDRDAQTHMITIRIIRDIEISAHAWVYEHRDRLPPRWFKILGVKEKSEVGVYPRFWELSCHLYERSDEASRPAAEAASDQVAISPASLPAGVKL